jgi:hypothetical protein
VVTHWLRSAGGGFGVCVLAKIRGGRFGSDTRAKRGGGFWWSRTCKEQQEAVLVVSLLLRAAGGGFGD